MGLVEQHARQSMAKGYSIIPIKTRFKKPLVWSWTENQITAATPAQFEQWLKQWPAMRYAIVCGAVSGIVVLDFDSEEAYQEAKRRGLPDTFTVKTHRGYHCYYLYPAAGATSHSPFAGCEVRSDGNYVIGSGCPHYTAKGEATGSVYTVVNSSPLVDLPSWAMETAKPAPKPVKPVDISYTPATDELEQASIDVFRINPDCTYAEWIAVGMALNFKFGESGFTLWDSWSQGGSKYAENTGSNDPRRKWDSFDPSKGAYGTIVKLANRDYPAGAKEWAKRKYAAATARTIDTATGEITIPDGTLGSQTSAHTDNLPADGGDVWRGMPQALATLLLDYAPPRQKNTLLWKLDDVITHVFQTGDPVVSAPRLYPDNESEQRQFRRAAKDYGLGDLLAWPKNRLVLSSDSSQLEYMPTNSCELSDGYPLPNIDGSDTYCLDRSSLLRRIMQRIVLPTMAERFRFRGMLVTTLSAWKSHTRLEARAWRQAYRESLAEGLERTAYDDNIKALALKYLSVWRESRHEMIGAPIYWQRPAIKPTDAEIIALSAQPNTTAKAISRALGCSTSTVIRAERRQGWLRPPPRTKQIVNPDHLNPDDDWKLHDGVLTAYMAYDENDKPLFDKPQNLYGRGRRDAAHLLTSGAADRLEVTVCGKTSAHEAVTHEDKLRLEELREKDRKRSTNGQRDTTPADTYRAGQTVKFIGSLVLEHAQRFGVDTVGTVDGNIERINDHVIGHITSGYTPSQDVQGVDDVTPAPMGIEYPPLADDIHEADTAPSEPVIANIANTGLQNTPSTDSEVTTMYAVPEREHESGIYADDTANASDTAQPSSSVRGYEGEVRTNASGVPEVFRGGYWHAVQPIRYTPRCTPQPKAEPLFNAISAAD